VHISKDDFGLLHGNPFVTFARKHETLADVKKRLQARMGVSDEVFKTWKFYLYTPSMAYRRERVALGDDFDVARHSWDVDESLGIEHESSKRTTAYGYKRQERAVKITG
jgi:ubiquitin carboxyl-terminal hydrolase 7